MPTLQIIQARSISWTNFIQEIEPLGECQPGTRSFLHHHISPFYVNNPQPTHSQHEEKTTPRHKTSLNTPPLQHRPSVAPELLKLPKLSGPPLESTATPHQADIFLCSKVGKTLPLVGAAYAHLSPTTRETVQKVVLIMRQAYFPTDFQMRIGWTWLYIHPWFSLSKQKQAVFTTHTCQEKFA